MLLRQVGADQAEAAHLAQQVPVDPPRLFPLPISRCQPFGGEPLRRLPECRLIRAQPEIRGVLHGRSTEYAAGWPEDVRCRRRSEEHTSELQSLMRISYAVFCLKKQTHTYNQ